MKSVVIDPYIFSYPSKKSKIKKIDFYIETLLSLNDSKDSNFLELLISDKALEILMTNNDYPEWTKLEESLKHSGLDKVYQVKDIIRIIDSLLTLNTVETKFGIKEILVNKVKTSSDKLINIRGINYSEEIYRIFMLIGQQVIDNVGCSDNYLIMSQGIGKSIDIQGEIIECEFYSNASQLKYPLKINNSFLLHENLKDIFEIIDEVEEWKNCQDTDVYKKIIDIYIYKKSELIENIEWSLGHRFLDSCYSNGFFTTNSKIKSLFKAIFYTLTKKSLSDMHALRTGPSGNNPQVMRGNNKAYRRDIDREYHLHYWETDNGFEFASVVVHNDFSIPE